jgi:hypothetical protein
MGARAWFMLRMTMKNTKVEDEALWAFVSFVVKIKTVDFTADALAG